MPPKKLDPRERIAAWRRARNMTLTALSEACGIRISGLSQIEHRRQQVNAEQMEAIAGGLGLTMSQFYDDALLRREQRASAAA